MMVLACAALAGSLLATDAQARGGRGHGGGGGAGHTGGFARVRVSDFGGAHVGGIRGGYIAGIPRGAVGYAARTGYGTGIRRPLAASTPNRIFGTHRSERRLW